MDPGVVVLRVVVRRRRRHVDAAAGPLAAAGGAGVLVTAGLLGHCATAGESVTVIIMAAHRTKLHAAWRSRVTRGRRGAGRTVFGYFSRSVWRARARNYSLTSRRAAGRRQRRTSPYRCSVVISKAARPRARRRSPRRRSATIVHDYASPRPLRSPVAGDDGATIVRDSVLRSLRIFPSAQ